MQPNKQPNKKEYLMLAVFGLVVILLAAGFLFRMEYKNYHEKIVIICQMLEGQKDGTDNLETASKLLKRSKAYHSQYGKEILEAYGYRSEYDNVYSSQYKQELLWTGILSLLLYMCYILAIIIMHNIGIKRTKKEFDELDAILFDFRKGNYEVADGASRSLYGSESSRVYLQLESLGDYLRLVKEQTERDKEEIKSLVTDISHQLKTPVAALKTCSQILCQEDLTPEERSEFSGRYNQQMKGLEDLLEALISISRMETGMIQIKKNEGCIYDTLVDAVSRVYLKAEEKQIDIGMEAEEKQQRLVLWYDKKWLCEAFINILENSIKYSAPNTFITIRMQERTSFLRIEIEDQGIGIPREEYPQVFKRFYRGKSETVQNQQGSGIGLYLTREIISRHGGTITVVSGNSSAQTGSTFLIQLPYMD